jgi:preprotein translocase subunit YajC
MNKSTNKGQQEMNEMEESDLKNVDEVWTKNGKICNVASINIEQMPVTGIPVFYIT